MTALKKEDLERLEAEYGLEPDGLTYQHRCSRIAAYQEGSGESWTAPVKKTKAKSNTNVTQSSIETHPLYGKKLLITPLMVPDQNRNLAYDEPLGPELTVRDSHAGDSIYGASEDIDRMVKDYEVVHVDRSKQVVAKTTFPKIGTEISWTLGKELCPVVRGNDGQRGYLWSFPARVMQVDDTFIQVFGLKALIQGLYPELLPKFSGKPMMTWIDGVTLAASIPQTDALLKQHRRQQLRDRAAGIDW